jgi:hypothetical protein
MHFLLYEKRTNPAGARPKFSGPTALFIANLQACSKKILKIGAFATYIDEGQQDSLLAAGARPDTYQGIEFGWCCASSPAKLLARHEGGPY